MPRRSISVAAPEREERRSLNHEFASVTGSGKPEEKPRDRVSVEDELEPLVLFTREVEQPLPDRRGDVLEEFLGHTRDSRYGRMTLATRQMRAYFQRSSIVQSFFRQQSRSASSATSKPIWLRNLKQSATVFGGA